MKSSVAYNLRNIAVDSQSTGSNYLRLFPLSSTLHGEPLSSFSITTANSLRYITDNQSVATTFPHVYPYHDEAADSYDLACQLNRKYYVAYDCFAGGGHTLLPIVKNGIAKEGIGSDINPRAVQLSKINSHLNELDSAIYFKQADIRLGLYTPTCSTLYIGNPPFALTVKGPAKDLARDGGVNGLELTREFISNAFVAAKAADTIIGVTYSRANSSGELELNSVISKLLPHDQPYKTEVLSHRKMWRNYRGEKLRPNPMDIREMVLKASPSDSKLIQQYEAAIQGHIKQGWDKLAYCSFEITKEKD